MYWKHFLYCFEHWRLW